MDLGTGLLNQVGGDVAADTKAEFLAELVVLDLAVSLEFKAGQLGQFPDRYNDLQTAGDLLGVDPDIPEYAQRLEPSDRLGDSGRG